MLDPIRLARISTPSISGSLCTLLTHKLTSDLHPFRLKWLSPHAATTHYGLSTLMAAAANPKLNRICDQSLKARRPAPGLSCSGTTTASPGISTMLSKPPDQKPEAASLLTTAPLARTTKILPLSALRVGPPAFRK